MSLDDVGPVDEGNGSEVTMPEAPEGSLARFIALLMAGGASPAKTNATHEEAHGTGAAATIPKQPNGESPDLQNTILSILEGLAGESAASLPEMEPMPSSDKLESRFDQLRLRSEANLANGGSGQVKNVLRTPTLLPLSAINETRVTNIRIQEDEAALAGLRDSLQRDGQLQEIVVVADRYREDRYSIVAGFRRYHAAVALGWLKIRAIVLPAGTDDQELHFLNAIENAQRFKLSGFEIASRAQLMRDKYRTDLAKYARRLGLSDSRVQNLVRYLEHLPQDVLKAWRDGDPLLTDHMLGRLAKMPPEEASQFWNAWKFRHAQSMVKSHSSQSSPRRSQNRPTSATLSRLWLTARRAAHLGEETQQLVVAIIEFCMGNTATVPGFFEPKQPSATPGKIRKGAGAKQQEQSDQEVDFIRQGGEIVLPLPFSGYVGFDKGGEDGDG
jgi:ParB/RepB/Spo0J family partition protein